MDGYNFFAELANNIGEVVTIFTTSGGESGRGFTGVLTLVCPDFVRLVTQIGPGPGCALGNCCDNLLDVSDFEDNMMEDQRGNQGRASCRPDNLGSIVDIPIDKIASFVHNAVGN
ncbi:hypothetical protein NBE98_21615 [Clostridium swellfunianum]|uniref:hypothetical protein n=1 Tax=Clostridium swellfunianum TaxID=1367462 RepID=UPI00202F2761|nr:hypothetical protein [Clostridium swellfunianum]MCM0650960.1 hypothetical protein [Clostridium swellfunianum]